MTARYAALALLCTPGLALAQGFAGLGTATEDGFATPEAGNALTFPADHFAHPQFRIEWWYLTANLETASGDRMGVQWTLFRSGRAPGDESGAEQVWMGHAALTTADRHLYDERLARGGIGQAGVEDQPFAAFIDDWQLTSTATGDADLFSEMTVTARGSDFAYDLALSATGPLLLQGNAGYSVKSPAGQASYYYSQPYYEVAGTVTLPEGEAEVTGRAWLDREWSSQPLAEDQTGWDWFSLHFDSGAKLMGFGLRDRSGGHFTSATWVDADGTVTPYGDGALSLEPLGTAQVADRTVPVRWRVSLPEEGVEIETAPLNEGAWMGTLFSYWEGPIAFSGSHAGRGYLEMTGYD